MACSWQILLLIIFDIRFIKNLPEVEQESMNKVN